MLFRSLVCVNHSEVQANDELEDVVKKAKSFLLNYATGQPYKLVHFGATPIAGKKFSPMKISPLKNDESDVILSENKEAKSINDCKNSQFAIPPSSRKKKKGHPRKS